MSPEETAKAKIDAAVAAGIGNNVQQIRQDIQALRDQTEAPDEKATYDQYLQAYRQAASGHDTVKVETLGGGTMGVNYAVGTRNTAIDQRLMSADQLMTDPAKAAEVLDHEDSTDGHAGQRAGVESVLDENGKVVDAVTLLEGGVESNMTRRYGQRSDQPKEVYGEGEAFANRVGQGSLQAYVRKSGGSDRAEFQKQIFDRSTLSAERKQEALERAGFTSPEIARVIGETREAFEQGPQQPAIAA